MDRLAEKVAIITGVGQGGIGEEIARTFIAQGAKVVINNLMEAEVQEVARQINASGGTAVAITGNIALPETWEKLTDTALKKFGQVDIVVNNASRLATEKDGMWPNEALWEQTFSVNVTGVYLSYKQLVPIFKEHGGGVFINIASATASVFEGAMNAYSASKAAVLNISRNAAAIFGQFNIRSVCVSPNFVPVAKRAAINARSEQQRWQHANTPLPFLGTTKDVANACLFLASEEAKYITGIDLPVDGGYCSRGFVPPQLVQEAYLYRQMQEKE